MYVMTQNGWIEVICGSMFSGKSEELIRRVRRAQFAKQKIAVFKPKIDNRYSEEAVVSHNGSTVIAHPIEQSNEMWNYLTDDFDLIAIDEAQFFGEDIIDTVQELANHGYRVILAGLDQDFKGVPFGPMPKLMAIAEQVTKLQAVCSVVVHQQVERKDLSMDNLQKQTILYFSWCCRSIRTSLPSPPFSTNRSNKYGETINRKEEWQ